MTRTTTSETDDRAYRLLIENITDYAIYMLDSDGVVANWNVGAERATWYAAEEIVGRHFRRFYPAEAQERGEPERALATALREGRFEAEGWRVRRDGSAFWADVVIEPVRDEAGRHVGFAEIARDRTDARAARDRLAEMAANLERALSNMPRGLCLFGDEDRLVLGTRRLLEIFNLPDGALRLGCTYDAVLEVLFPDGPPPHGRDVAAVRKRHAQLLHDRHDASAVETLDDGRAIAITYRFTEDRARVVTFEDVSERRRTQARIAHMALHDTLTGLSNRSHFTTQLTKAVDAAGPAAGCAVLYLDLDRFKPVNDTLGHAVGDAVLQAVARRLKHSVRRADIVARLGGDEFAIIQREVQDAAEADALALRVVNALRQPLVVKGHRIAIGVSIGITLSPADGKDAGELLRRADLALYQAKADGRGDHRFFHPEMEAAVASKRAFEAAFRGALDNGEFEVHYQPLVTLPGRTLAGFEALVRWKRPGHGLVPPGDFVPHAEKSGLIVPLGAWVLRTACIEAARWPDGIGIAVNVSAAQFAAPGLADTVAGALAASGLAPGRLELEITETAMMENLDNTLAVLRRIKALGVRVAMDDFGTGYSSLSFLRSFAFDKVKIDRSFINDLGERAEADAIVRAVTSLCSTLGVTSTAEGVETELQLRQLEAQSCDQVQGYLFSRPRPAAALDALIRTFARHGPKAAGRRPWPSCPGEVPVAS
ncbi:putative bifunctional diguanylate cyclase/phosphodiesterase [Marinivivus vitaminiproducens]|uniref:putative bifunctional diguanylate cyclase/phosphodiesterase n=1 Tax=Marinivivus vitaminiproducens TaxID=3035935 RepID=UPI0027982754|nr:EAL domain-containing protein [Geminicoccaceae bacterium SCSIO 64248]